MLHSLSHLLIRELALECGYNAASIRERIYADTAGDQPQAGILIYTAAADSDGTLGGLVDLGKPENLGRLLTQALNRAKICSSDPLCSEHDPEKDRSLHGAACHACSFVAETSCERGNRYLDRSLLISTLERTDAAFFKDLQSPDGPREVFRHELDEVKGDGKLPSGKKPSPLVKDLDPSDRGDSRGEAALRMSDLATDFPVEPFALRLIVGAKVSRVRVNPVVTSDLELGQRVVMASPSLRLHGKSIPVAVGSINIGKLTDAVTGETFIHVSVKDDGGLAQAKMSVSDWQDLKSIGLVEAMN
jgi:hypothetical protein